MAARVWITTLGGSRYTRHLTEKMDKKQNRYFLYAETYILTVHFMQIYVEKV